MTKNDSIILLLVMLV